MKHLLTILCLFIFSCDSGGDDAVEVEGCTDSNSYELKVNCNFDLGSLVCSEGAQLNVGSAIVISESY